jgi:DNA-binding CsgD family transcriptional regulator
MKREGLMQSEIAEHLGCSQKTISNDLRSGTRMGVKLDANWARKK